MKTGKVSQLVLGGLLSALLSCASASAQVLKGSTEQAKAVTNEDVLQMVHQGAPEQAIIAAIRANPTKFDLPLDKMLALHRQGVSAHVLNAMSIARMRERKAGGEKNADELSPQPYPPKSRTNGTLLNSGAQQTLLGTPANSPSGDGSKSALVPLVQRPAADTNQGGTAMSPTAVERNGSVDGGSVQTSASGMPAVQTGAINGGSGKAGVDANRAAVTSPAMMPKTSPGLVGTSQTMSAQGNISPSTTLTQSARTVAVVPAGTTTTPSPRSASSPRPANPLTAMGRVPSQVNLQVAEECAKDPTLRILYVTGGSSATGVFTPGGHYTIWGCSFGGRDPRDTVSMEFPMGYCASCSGDDVEFFSVFFEVVNWSPNSIDIRLALDFYTTQYLKALGGGSSIGGGFLYVLPIAVPPGQGAQLFNVGINGLGN